MAAPSRTASPDGDSPLIRDLAHLSSADLSAVGGKAANLGELIRAGFDVPPGFCVTTEAYRRAVRGTAVETGTGTDAAAARAAVLGAPIPTGEVLYEGPMRLCALSTIPYYGYGFRMFPYADERPDRMNLRVATIGPLTFVRHFPEIWRGEYHSEEDVFDYLVESVTIDVDPAVDFEIGGDPRGLRSSVSATLSPPIRLVDFYAPPSAQ